MSRGVANVRFIRSPGSAASSILWPGRGIRKRWGRSSASGARSGANASRRRSSSIWPTPARIGHFIDWYNFERVHSGIDGLVPADRYFHAAPEMARPLKDAWPQTPWSWRVTVCPSRRSI